MTVATGVEDGAGSPPEPAEAAEPAASPPPPGLRERWDRGARWWREPATPRPEWIRAACALVGVVAGASGFATATAFSQPSATKWFLLVTACAATGVVLVSERPRTTYACLVVLIAPFADLNTQVAGIATSPLVPVLALGVPVLLLTTPSPRVGSALGRLGPWFVVLLVPALLFGPAPQAKAGLFLVAGLVAWTCVRADAHDPRAVRWIYLSFVGLVLVQAALAVYEFVSGAPVSLYGGGTSSYGEDYFYGYEDGVMRVSGIFTDPISLGNVLAMGLPMAVAVVVDRRLAPTPRLVALGAVGLVGFALAVTYSRMSWIGAVLGALVTTVVLCRGYRARALAGVAAVVAVLGAVASVAAGPTLQRRLISILDPTASTVSTSEGDLLRERLWATTESVIASRPYFGVGLDRLAGFLEQGAVGAGSQTHAHSVYLQLTAEAGMLGVAALVLLGFALLVDGRSASRLVGGPDGVLVAGVVGALASLAVSCLTDYTARYTAVLSVMLVPVVLLALLAKRSGSRA